VASVDQISPEGRFHDLIQDLDAIVWEADATTWQFSFVSRKAEKLLGYPVESWLADPGFWVGLVHPEDRDAAVALCKTATEEGRDHEFNYRAIRANGEVVWMRDIVHVIKDEAGRPKQLRGVMVDVTERMGADRELREGRERYRQMFEGNGAVQLLVDPQSGEIVKANPAARAFYGYTREELHQMNFTDLTVLPPDQVRQALASAAWESGDGRTLPHRLASGEIRQVEANSSPIDVDGRELLYLIVHDVTDFYRAEEQIREAEARYRALVEQTPAIVYMRSLSGGPALTTYVSPEIERILGVTPEEAMSEPYEWEQRIYPEDHDRETEAVLRHHRTGEPYQGEYRMYHKDGSVRWFRDVAVVVKDALGRKRFCHGVMMDITLQKLADQERERLAAVLNTTTDLVTTSDADGRILTMNPAGRRLLGLGEDEDVTELLSGDLLTAPGRDLAQSEVIPTLEREGTWIGETTFLARDGREIPVSQVALAHPSPDGAVEFFSIVARDISEQRRAADELNRRGAILEAVGAAGQLLMVADSWESVIPDILAGLGWAARVSRIYIFENDHRADGRTLSSQRYEWVAPGIQPEIDNQALQEFMLTDTVGERWPRTLSQGGVIHGNVAAFPERERPELERQDIKSLVVVPLFSGTEWWGFIGFDECTRERDWSASEIDALKAAGGLIGATIQRERAEAARGRTEEQYRRLVEASPDGIAIHRDGVFLYANPAMAHLLGVRRADELIGRSLFQFVHPDFQEPLTERLERLASEGTDLPYVEETLIRTDGSIVHVEAAAMVMSYRGEPAIQSVIRDITDRQQAQEAMRASEERYRRLVEMSPEPVAVHSEGLFVFANQAMADMLGAESPEQIVGTPAMDRVHPDYRDLVKSRIRQVTEGGENTPLIEEKLVRFDGRAIDVEVAGIPFAYEGRPAGQVVVRDITERKRAERDLYRQNAYLEALHETALGLMARLDVNDVLQAIVARAASLAGTEHGYLCVAGVGENGEGSLVLQVGTGVFEQHVGNRFGPNEGLPGRVWASGEPLWVEDYSTWELRSDRVPRDLFHPSVAIPLKGDQGISGVIGVARTELGRVFEPEEIALLTRFAELASIAMDNARLYSSVELELAERKRAEEELNFRAQLLDIVQDAVVATDLQDSIVYWNAFASSLYGWSADEVRGKSAVDVLTTEPFRDQIRAARTDGALWTGEIEAQRKDGSTFLTALTMSSIRGTDGRVIGSITVGRDVTARSRADEALRQAFEHEKEVSRRLRTVDEVKNTFLSSVSHELRTPLSALLGMSLTLEREEADLSHEEGRELVRRLAANARKLDQLLADLLDLDRLGRGIIEPRRRQTDVGALVRRTVEASDLVGRRPIKLDTESVVVAVDGPKVERIVENMLANAARHTPVDTTIWVQVRAQGGGVLLVVEDAGAGVPAHLENWTLESPRHASDANAPGVGIGLSLVARLAELHGGRAWVEEREGGGASFRVHLPDRGVDPATLGDEQVSPLHDGGTLER
jgi:PAS domain S-box-containing protein